jgi:hypothetical protein
MLGRKQLPTLAERTSGDFDTWGHTHFRVTRRDGVELTELAVIYTGSAFKTERCRGARSSYRLEVVESDLVAEKVQQHVLESTAVAV